MRTPTYTAIVVTSLTLVMLLPAASAHVTPTGTQEHTANLAGFVPPIVPLADGDRVEWTSTDVAHTFTEGAPGEVPDPCMAPTFSSLSPGGATFTLAQGSPGTVLQADEDPSDDQAPAECTSATAVDHGAAMQFHCEFHPWMNGLLVVYDAQATSQAAILNDPALLLQRDALASNV